MRENGQINRIKTALAQTAVIWEDKAANYSRAEHFIREAADCSAEVIFFPEMSFTGFSMNTGKTKELHQETAMHMAQLAQTYHISIGFGWVKDCGGQCRNQYTVTDPTGTIVSDYAKIHPFSFSGEDQKFEGGSALSWFLLNGICFSNFICYDLRFPEIFQAASERAHVIVVAANWPAQRSSHWQALLRARAIECQVYILAVNCVGSIGGTEYAGGSCVINPDGEVQEQLPGTEGIVYFDLADNVRQFREAFPVKRDRRKGLYRDLQ